MTEFANLIFTIAQSPLAYVVLVSLLVIDGFLPLVPGETMVVTLAALGVSGHGPDPLIVLVVAIASTMVGDGIAFLIGRSIHPTRWVWMRGTKAQRGLEWASARIEHSPGVILIGAKFLPFVRVAVTMTAGASGLPVKKYLVYSFFAATLYTGYHVAVAITAGELFVTNPLLGLAASITFGVLSAALIGGIHRLVTLRRARTSQRTQTGR